MRLPRITGPGIPRRDNDPVPCARCPRWTTYGQRVGVITNGAQHLNICPTCADELAPNARHINPRSKT